MVSAAIIWEGPSVLLGSSEQAALDHLAASAAEQWSARLGHACILRLTMAHTSIRDRHEISAVLQTPGMTVAIASGKGAEPQQALRRALAGIAHRLRRRLQMNKYFMDQPEYDEGVSAL